MIRELGLKGCARNTIGDRQHKGCSSGQNRRVSVGLLLLTNGALIILDGPATGLDAASALQMVKILSSLAAEGKTVLMTSMSPSRMMNPPTGSQYTPKQLK